MKSDRQVTGVQALAPKPAFSYFFRTTKKKSTGRFRQVLDSTTEFGRREWTRTIDPHHVKVGSGDVTELPGTYFS